MRMLAPGWCPGVFRRRNDHKPLGPGTLQVALLVDFDAIDGIFAGALVMSKHLPVRERPSLLTS
jgi:hypothetical protein